MLRVLQDRLCLLYAQRSSMHTNTCHNTIRILKYLLVLVTASPSCLLLYSLAFVFPWFSWWIVGSTIDSDYPLPTTAPPAWQISAPRPSLEFFHLFPSGTVVHELLKTPGIHHPTAR